ncbi:cytochrome P450 [Auriscalpium vulgare]|uniref:Cytochrome P450 n=1 Tax=Auriscalpium vulgare TaxID=40419 RepID=A0ACB8RYK2_9AGAM|nr:cytochrome P450 [Auriscalpium vulgare]
MTVDISWSLAASALLALFIVSRVSKSIYGIKLASGLPAWKVPFQPLAMPGAALPTTWWNPGIRWTWSLRASAYKELNTELIAMVPFMAGQTAVYTNSVEVARQVVAGGVQSPWIKPVSASKAIIPWGMNLIGAEKETWRRHRRIMGPAFNSKTYGLVWAETARVFRDMATVEGWDAQNTVNVRAVQDYTFKLALFVISACGFGVPFAWDEPPMNEDGTMGVQKALKVYTDNSLLMVITPEWAFKLPISKLQEYYQARETLREYMTKQIADRKTEIHGEVEGATERQDVFSLLVRASEGDGKLKLDDSELACLFTAVGNVFGLMFAGHETTAHTLAATLGFLSIYPDIQKEVYDEIVSVVGDREPTLEDFGKLEKVQASFYEALRLYPAGYVMIREAIEDTVLNVPNEGGQPGTRPLPVQKGLQVVVDMVGVQYNPRYFPDPEKYDPTRWYGVSTESEALTAFSIGPRTCIGRKFAAIEAVCFLTFLLRDWHVAPSQRPGETGEQWRARVMDAAVGMTLGVKSVPVTLTRRRPLPA